MAAQLSIVIVNWNGGRFLRGCIESVLACPPALEFEVLVVDNGSSDDSLEWLRSELTSGGSKIRLIENATNLGFGKANNQAFVLSNTPLILLLNNDAEVTPGAIDRLINTLRSEDRIGVCGPRLVNADGSLQVSAWRNPPTAWEILLAGLRLYRLLPRRMRGELMLGRFWDHSRKRNVGMLSGAALLLRRTVLDEVGGFDERFHMYAEDDEWCLRVLRSGWSLVFEPGAVVVHHGARSASARWDSLERKRRICDEGLRFQKYSLTKPHFVSNLLANSLVVSLAHIWKKLTGGEAAETRMKLELYFGHLRNAFKNK